jgi:Tol biopolymer transport system component
MHRFLGFRRTIPALAVVASVVAQLMLAARVEAVFSGANGRIAFGAEGDIYTVRPDGTGPKLVTSGRSFDPQWSPDGKRIAFLTVRDGYFDIHLMNEDGSNPTNLTQSPGVDDGDFAWSPDGTKIAFVRADGTGDSAIYVMSSDGTEQKTLTSPGYAQADFSPRWSPDGQEIVFSRSYEWGSFKEIFVMKADGSGEINLTNFQATRDDPQAWADAGGARWSPDGTKIGFHQTSKVYGLRTNVWTMNPDGSDRRRLTTGLREFNPEWSPDSARIAFQSPFDISTTDRYGSGQTALTNDSDEDWEPQWSPDGRRIVFQRIRQTPDGGTDGSDVYVMNADGTGQVNLTDQLGSFARGADWQPLVRSSFKNGPEFCRTLRDAAGEPSFGETYRTFGKCVNENSAS